MNSSRALVIEDDPDLVTIFSRALQVGGFVTESATSGKKALSYLQNNVPSIIMLDLHLPDIDGIEILQKIRADGQLVHLADKMADMVLIKPVSITQ